MFLVLDEFQFFFGGNVRNVLVFELGQQEADVGAAEAEGVFQNELLQLVRPGRDVAFADYNLEQAFVASVVDIFDVEGRRYSAFSQGHGREGCLGRAACANLEQIIQHH